MQNIHRTPKLLNVIFCSDKSVASHRSVSSHHLWKSLFHVPLDGLSYFSTLEHWNTQTSFARVLHSLSLSLSLSLSWSGWPEIRWSSSTRLWARSCWRSIPLTLNLHPHPNPSSLSDHIKKIKRLKDINTLRSYQLVSVIPWVF